MKVVKNRLIKILAVLMALTLVGGGIALYLYKGKACSVDANYSLKLQDNDNVETLAQKLETECGLKYPRVFKKIAVKMNLRHWMKKGRYTVKPEMTLVDLVKLFREGKGKTVNLTIRGLTDIETFAENCGARLEGDTSDFLSLMNDAIFLKSIGFTKETIFALPLPDTYNVYWHTEPDELLLKLKTEYDKFWNAERMAKADSMGLNPVQVSTLASIVCKETNKTDEMPMVAGMYLNRLKTDMALQADPTIKFALNEPTLKRIYNVHLKVISPYNTYMNKGLPPGPICIPSKQSLDAVLNYARHNFIFMCAKEDFSGYHNFAATYLEHLKNARRYQLALDRNGVQ